jgi:hypothetical protein
MRIIQSRGAHAMTRRQARWLALVADFQGGLTYDVRTHRTPRDGYAVAAFPGRERKVKHLTAGVLLRYIRDNADALYACGAHLGAWRDNGTWYLDVSLVEPEREIALTLARVNAQLAIYDLSTRESLML